MDRITITFFFVLSCVFTCIAQGNALFTIEVDGKFGFIDKDARVVIKPRFDEARGFSESLAAVRVGDDWGFIDEKGKIVIKPQFFTASGFSEGRAAVGVWFPRKKVRDSKLGFYSYIDSAGNLISDERFELAFAFSDGLANVLTADYKHIFVDRYGKRKFEFDTYEPDFQNGLLLFKTQGNMPDSRAGYIDKSGRVVIPASYRSGENFSEGFACVYDDKGAGFIDISGKAVIDFKFTFCRSFSEGLAAVFADDKYGYIDKSGAVVIKPQFAEANPFSDGVAVVRVGENSKKTNVRETKSESGNMFAPNQGAFGVIDRTGRFIISPKYAQIGNFRDGLAWVNLSDDYIVHGEASRWGYINKQGKIVWKSF